MGKNQTKLYTVDVVKVIGPLTVQEKAHNLSTFMTKGTWNYNPCILVATGGATKAGINLERI